MTFINHGLNKSPLSQGGANGRNSSDSTRHRAGEGGADKHLPWVFEDLTREAACEMLAQPPNSSRPGSFVVRQKGDKTAKQSYVLTVLCTDGQIAHYFLQVTNGQWIVQNILDKPCAPASKTLLEVLSLLSNVKGMFRLPLLELVVPHGVYNPWNF